jgi:hypothetical protein
MTDKTNLSLNRVFWFWVPLAVMWLIMAAEQPAITAIVSRLPDAKLNLAAFGLTFSWALIVESPVIMLLTGGTALTGHRQSYNRLLQFTHILAWGFGAIHLLLCLTPAYAFILREWVGAPIEVIEPSRQAFLAMFLWTPMIAYRRMWEGTMIRYGHPGKVTQVIVVRLASTVLVLLAGLWLQQWSGAVVGGIALSVGVTIGAAVAYWLARPILQNEIPDTTEHDELLTWQRLYTFYFPLALSTLITMVGMPIVSLGLSRAPQPLESLAIWPVVMSVVFIGRSMGIAFQEVGVAMLRSEQAYPVLRRFAWGLAFGAGGLFLLFGVTPAAEWWYGNISGLSPDLVALAILPTVLLVPVPLLNALISWQRALLIHRKQTKWITGAVLLNMATLMLLVLGLPYVVNVSGAISAAIAFSASLIAEWIYLWWASERRLETPLVVQPVPVGD